MSQSKRFRLKKIGVFAASEERFRQLAEAIGEPCVWLSEHMTMEVPAGVKEVIMDAAPAMPESGPDVRTARRPRRKHAHDHPAQEPPRFFARGRLFIYQCPEHVD